MKYQTSVPEELSADRTDTGLLPFGDESTRDETWFRCRFDPEPTARRVLWFHKPETIADVIEGHVDGRGGGADETDPSGTLGGGAEGGCQVTESNFAAVGPAGVCLISLSCAISKVGD